MGDTAGFDISKIFHLGSTKNSEGNSVNGIGQDDFMAAAAQSIFAKANLDFSTVFEELDSDGDKVLTSEELSALNRYLDEDMVQEMEEVAPDTDIEGIINGQQNMETKLTQLKALDMSGEDVKKLDDGTLTDVLNIISGAYADKPEDIKGDTLFGVIANNVDKDKLNEVINGQNSGYWLSKYGAGVMTQALGLNEGTDDSDENDTAADLMGSMDFSDPN